MRIPNKNQESWRDKDLEMSDFLLYYAIIQHALRLT